MRVQYVEVNWLLRGIFFVLVCSKVTTWTWYDNIFPSIYMQMLTNKQTYPPTHQKTKIFPHIATHRSTYIFGLWCTVVRLLVASRLCLVARWLMARWFLGGELVGGETPWWRWPDTKCTTHLDQAKGLVPHVEMQPSHKQNGQKSTCVGLGWVASAKGEKRVWNCMQIWSQPKWAQAIKSQCKCMYGPAKLMKLQVDPSFELVFSCKPVWPGLKASNPALSNC